MTAGKVWLKFYGPSGIAPVSILEATALGDRKASEAVAHCVEGSGEGRWTPGPPTEATWRLSARLERGLASPVGPGESAAPATPLLGGLKPPPAPAVPARKGKGTRSARTNAANEAATAMFGE